MSGLSRIENVLQFHGKRVPVPKLGPRPPHRLSRDRRFPVFMYLLNCSCCHTVTFVGKFGLRRLGDLRLPDLRSFP